MSEQITIPIEFIRSLTRADWDKLLANNGVLDAEQCARLWRMTDHQDKPPSSLMLMFSREDVMRIWPPKPEQKG